jgi:hypothetical protein
MHGKLKLKLPLNGWIGVRSAMGLTKNIYGEIASVNKDSFEYWKAELLLMHSVFISLICWFAKCSSKFVMH